MKDDSPNGRTPATGTLSWLGAILADRTLDATETLLMVGLADHVDAADECFVGIDTLATYARVSYATAKRRLAALEAKGRLTRERRRRSDGNLSTYTWTLVRPGLNLSHDQGSPGRAMTMAHPDAPAEVPSGEPPSENPPSTDVDKDPREAPDYGFEKAWAAYPRRNGKRLGKAAALRRWVKYPYPVKARIYQAVRHYAAAVEVTDTIPRDFERFLKDDWWEGWEDGPGGTTEAPAPVDPRTAAAAAMAERNRRRMSGEACRECGDSGWVPEPEGNSVAPCACRVAS